MGDGAAGDGAVGGRGGGRETVRVDGGTGKRRWYGRAAMAERTGTGQQRRRGHISTGDGGCSSGRRDGAAGRRPDGGRGPRGRGTGRRRRG